MANLLTKQESTTGTAIEQGGSLVFYLVLVAFLIITAAFGGLFLLNRAQKEAQQTLVEEVKEKEKNLKGGILDQIFTLEQRLKNLRTLLSRHVFPSNVFGFLEKNTLPEVRFLNMVFDAQAQKLDMSGEASSFSAISKQVNVFERDPQVERVEFGGLSSSGANLAGFKLTIMFKKSFLLLRQ